MECLNLLFLILLSRLSLTVRAAKRTLDMAPNAVDDNFFGCRDRMLKAVTEPGGLLDKELQTTKKFADMWNSTGSCEKEINGLTSFHLRALQSYGNSNNDFRKTFNDMVYTKGRNATVYKNEFPFKSLHFLLTDAMEHLNYGKICTPVYYGTANEYIAETGENIRFGKFLRPGSKKTSQEEKCEDGTLFNITSCSVFNMENYTCISEEVELLISPIEVFTVENIQSVSGDSDYTLITLTHSHFLTNHNCNLFESIIEATTPSSRDLTRTPGGSSNPLLSSTILALVASLLSLYYCTAPQ